jgi:septum formation protein
MASTTPKIILGSSSKWRKEMLSKMGYTFDTMSPDIDEKAIRDPNPHVLTLKIARAKAEALLPKVTEPAILICSDQVIVYNGEIREKPKDEEECRKFLRSYKDHPAEAVDGLVIINTATGKRAEGVATAKQYFHEIPEHLIDELIKQGDVMWCAGGFTIEHMTPYLKSLEGEEETIQGLPKTLTQQLIDQVRQ